ncbi:MAG: YkgJ family cysteine cluster protein [Sedimentisphaerales bacterium]|nr:YkgJ family cysteine cluster protein [Sedimentisphaerales bacterium]
MGDVTDGMMGTEWYVGGLHFECRQCGGCCAGPTEGYIWVSEPEIELIANHLKMTPSELHARYLQRVGVRTTIVEHAATKDCIFLREVDGRRRCAIYSVRPNQCRTWPFWPENLSTPDAWSRAGIRCPGINFGRYYSYQEIERIRKSTRWWEHPKDTAECWRR